MVKKSSLEKGSGEKEKTMSSFTQLVIFGYHLLAFGLPMIVCLSANDAVTLPKAVLLWTATIMIVCFYLAGAISRGQMKVSLAGPFLPLGLLLLTLVFSSLFSVHPVSSLIGNYQRYDGGISLLCFIALFIIARKVFDRPARIRPLLYTIIFTAALLSVYGLLQFYGIEFLPWSKALFEKQRSHATLGNPIYFGAYLSLVFPLALAEYIARSKKADLFLTGGSAILIFSCLITTGSRAAWLGTGVGLLVFFILLGREKKWNRKTALMTVLLLIAMLGFFSGLLKTATPSDDLDLLTRLKETFRLEAGSQRIEIWKAALSMIGHKPLYGFGPGAFHLVADSYSSLKLAQTTGGTVLIDSPHNLVLQITAGSGLFGLLSFLWFFLVNTANHAKAWIDRPDESVLFRLGVLSGITGYLIALQFGINALTGTTLFWIVAGLNFPSGDERPSFDIRMKSALYLRSLEIVALFFVSFLLVTYPVRFLQADILYRQATVTTDTQAQIDLYQQAYCLNPFNPLYPGGAGLIYESLAQQTKGVPYFQAAEDLYLQAEKINRFDLVSHYYLGRLYFFGAENLGPAYISLAEAKLKECIKIFPHFYLARALLADYYFWRKDYAKTVSEGKIMVQIAPQNEEGYLWTGKGLLAMGREEESRRYLEKTIQMNGQNEEARRLLTTLGGKTR